MFKAISCSYLSDFYWVRLKIWPAVDVKSEYITLEQSKVIEEYTCFLGLSCKFYWEFSFVTFAQKRKFIRMIQILRYYTNIAVNIMFVKRKYLLLKCNPTSTKLRYLSNSNEAQVVLKTDVSQVTVRGVLQQIINCKTQLLSFFLRKLISLEPG